MLKINTKDTRTTAMTPNTSWGYGHHENYLNIDINKITDFLIERLFTSI